MVVAGDEQLEILEDETQSFAEVVVVMLLPQMRNCEEMWLAARVPEGDDGRWPTCFGCKNWGTLSNAKMLSGVQQPEPIVDWGYRDPHRSRHSSFSCAECVASVLVQGMHTAYYYRVLELL